MVMLMVSAILNIAVSSVLIGLMLADRRIRRTEKKQQEKEEAPDALEERRLREFEKAWQEGLSNILNYNLETAEKAGRTNGR